ncbi:MAG: hypothetical protein IJ193_09580 [Bacilli bacterium]|nr:hypothetical protein [Bacilli bacterium]
MFIDSNMDYIKVSKDYYHIVLNEIREGLGTATDMVLYLICPKKDKEHRFLKRVVENVSNDYIVPDDYEVICKYYMTKLSYNDDKSDEEVFDVYHIKDIGYYEITDYYKNMHIAMDVDKELLEKCRDYEEHYQKEA